MNSSAPATPVSPKSMKTKPSQKGIPVYGCGELKPGSSQPCAQFVNGACTEHLERLMTGSVERMQKTISSYKDCLRVIFDHTPTIPQTSITLNNQTVTSLTPNYLCLQCPTT